VSVALAHGSLLDCELVSITRGRADAVWVLTAPGDVFIPPAEVIDLWPDVEPASAVLARSAISVTGGAKKATLLTGEMK
jgi:hypothetical protein